ncbi:hypothetical protein TNCV_1328621 [Trichonephila clavipes]|nr:hypothetical protein TNCV_1328621 [Trichonephila clavipes]
MNPGQEPMFRDVLRLLEVLGLHSKVGAGPIDKNRLGVPTQMKASRMTLKRKQEYNRKMHLTVESIRAIILLILSRERDKAPIVAEALTPSPVGPGPTRGLLATDLVILNHGQVTWTTPEQTPPLLTTTPHQRSWSRTHGKSVMSLSLSATEDSSCRG